MLHCQGLDFSGGLEQIESKSGAVHMHIDIAASGLPSVNSGCRCVHVHVGGHVACPGNVMLREEARNADQRDKPLCLVLQERTYSIRHFALCIAYLSF